MVEDVCLARSPCLNDGVCTSLEGGRFQCACRGLWRGTTCSEPRHPCREKALCGKRFACQLAPHSLAGYTCNCDAVPGYGPKSGELGGRGKEDWGQVTSGSGQGQVKAEVRFRVRSGSDSDQIS